MKEIIHPLFLKEKELLEQIPASFENEGCTIYNLRNRIKVIKLGGREVNVKRFHVPCGLNRWVYSWGIRKPKGWRAFHFASVYLECGIRTPQPMAYFEERNCLGLLKFSYFVSEQLDFPHTLYDVCKMEISYEMEALAKAVALFAAEMHEKKIFHHDFTPGNVLWRGSVKDGFELAVVDINRTSFRQVSLTDGLDNLKKMWGAKFFTECLAREYALLREADPEFAVKELLRRRAKFWKRYLKKHQVPFTVEY